MKPYFKIFFLSFVFLFSVNLSAQLDNTNGNEKKGSIKTIGTTNAKEAKKPKSILVNPLDGFKSAYKKEQEKLKKQQAAEKINNKGILTKAKINEARFLKAFKKINGRYIYPKIDQDLGSYRSNAKSVNIICRDFQYPDGDRVTIYVNDEPVVPNITLKQSYQRFNIPLKIGINKIAFKALNQGSSGPNTAAFKVFDSSGNLISSKEWNLATGAKATIIISKTK